ncbi:MAG: leucine-rich repeat domain-containing protein [Oscillospiraceae bacterium]|nr:leucine-rich repeat domain-containing protein [Oscillospiraceae bacterium]
MKKLTAFLLAAAIILTTPLVVSAETEFTTTDALTVLRHTAGLIELTSEQIARYDLNNDRRVDSADALEILRRAAELDYIIIKGERYSIYLTELDLTGQKLTDEDIIPLQRMVNLKVLILFFNQISDLTLLSRLVNLESLNLHLNEIVDISPLEQLTNLRIIYLGMNNITDITTLGGLTNLEYIGIGNSGITDITPLSDLTNLRTLHLNANQITDITPLSGLKNLNELSISHNQITDISSLYGLTNLNYLFLKNNLIAREHIESLREALPDCIFM